MSSLSCRLFSPSTFERFFCLSGKLEIAEVTSRFSDVKAFTALVNSVGFELISKVRWIRFGRISGSDAVAPPKVRTKQSLPLVRIPEDDKKSLIDAERLELD